MRSTNVTFKNKDHIELSGKIDWPVGKKPDHFVIFAHCFTCHKNYHAITNISRALTLKGFAVLRFDFTGLGKSEGEFENTTFSSNVSDLISAAGYLKENYKSPALLVGHSLGGAAAVFAAPQIDSIKAVSIIGTPSEPAHVAHHLRNALMKIERDGKAKVNIAGRPFDIRKDFLDDLKENKMEEILKELRVPLLIMHSPQDSVVDIIHAKKNYTAAHHPKSFISLDGTDHLLTDERDGLYAGEMISSWALRYLPLSQRERTGDEKEYKVIARLSKDDKFTTEIRAGKHSLLADEPKPFNAYDLGPTPYDLVLAGLGACTVMTVHMYAKKKKWDLQEAEAKMIHSHTHAEDCQNCVEGETKMDNVRREIILQGDLDEKQKIRLLEIADKCPVHKSLSQGFVINSKLRQQL